MLYVDLLPFSRTREFSLSTKFGFHNIVIILDNNAQSP